MYPILLLFDQDCTCTYAVDFFVKCNLHNPTFCPLSWLRWDSTCVLSAEWLSNLQYFRLSGCSFLPWEKTIWKKDLLSILYFCWNCQNLRFMYFSILLIWTSTYAFINQELLVIFLLSERRIYWVWWIFPFPNWWFLIAVWYLYKFWVGWKKDYFHATGRFNRAFKNGFFWFPLLLNSGATSIHFFQRHGLWATEPVFLWWGELLKLFR